MRNEKLYKGIPISPGVEIGETLIIAAFELHVPENRIKDEERLKEIERFKKARDAIVEYLEDVRASLEPRLRSLMDSQIMILKDSKFDERVREIIEKNRRKAEFAVQLALKELADQLEYKGTEYMKERAKELKHLARDLIEKLQEAVGDERTKECRNRILVASDLSLDDTVHFIKNGIKAIALAGGGKTSHTAILVRNYKIPAVFALGEEILEVARDGDTIIVDGSQGVVILNPKESTLERYKKKQEEYRTYTTELLKKRDIPAVTRDHKEITILANIDFPEELFILEEYGNYGIGLFRTELLYSTLKDDEEGQKKIYEEIAEKVYPFPAVIRAFDLGGDKVYRIKEKNPFLGLRGIRVLLKEREMFKRQIRAIIRANKRGNLKFMIPMVSEVEEVLETKKIVEDVANELGSGNIPEFGIMIETPASAILADKFAPHVNFMSIGTNDLTQYVLAVDRRSPKVSYLFDHLNPAVLRLIDYVVKVGHEKNIWVGVCGELASDLYGIPLLIGLGVDELSVTPSLLLEAKELIRAISLEEAKNLAKEAIEASTGDEVRKMVTDYLRDKLPKFLMFLPYA